MKCRVISTLRSENGLTCCESEILSSLGHGKDLPSIVIILNSTRRITRKTVRELRGLIGEVKNLAEGGVL